MSIAVLLPVYGGDRADHFDEALRSVEQQVDCTEATRIYLGVDGPLSAALEAVIERHRPHLHTVVRHDDHVGPTANMNGLLARLGDERLVFRMDADDVCAPERFSRQIAFMDAHPDIDILGTDIEEINDETGASYIRRFPTDPERMTTAICKACPVAHPAVCVRPRVFRELGGYPDMRGQDIALWFDALRRGFRISNIPEPLLQLRVSGDFLARRSWMGRALPEFRIYMAGIWRLHGVTWRYVLPISRLLLRCAGPRISGRVYASGLRNWLTARGHARAGSGDREPPAGGDTTPANPRNTGG